MNAKLPRRWLEQADEDLVVGRLLLPEDHFGHACFFAQQGIEKSLNAYLLARLGGYPRTHKLVDLLQECANVDEAFSRFLDACMVVEQYYLPSRYPDAAMGDAFSPGTDEAEEAVVAAEGIFRFVEQQV
jgi:HEPN domain-containing protein